MTAPVTFVQTMDPVATTTLDVDDAPAATLRAPTSLAMNRNAKLNVTPTITTRERLVVLRTPTVLMDSVSNWLFDARQGRRSHRGADLDGCRRSGR